jgi:hypothetical protein
MSISVIKKDERVEGKYARKLNTKSVSERWRKREREKYKNVHNLFSAAAIKRICDEKSQFKVHSKIFPSLLQ